MVGLGLLSAGWFFLFFSLSFLQRGDTHTRIHAHIYPGARGQWWYWNEMEWDGNTITDNTGLLTLAAFSFVPNCVTGDNAKAMVYSGLSQDKVSLEYLCVVFFSCEPCRCAAGVVVFFFFSLYLLKSCQTLVHPWRMVGYLEKYIQYIHMGVLPHIDWRAGLL